VPAPDTNPKHAPTTLQLLLEDVDYHYDAVDNPVEIDDFRNPAEWPAGSQPVSRKIQYDDLYRVTRVDYAYPKGTDTWVSPFDAEDNGGGTDPRRATPSPHVTFANRVVSQTFQYDWLGNTKNTDDDAHGFYDRSLGAITNGAPSVGPYQLSKATGTGTRRGGSLGATYDAAGNLSALTLTRSGPCAAGAGLCSQQFAYDWDEAGRLVAARRFDGGATTASAQLAYAYDATNDRTLKAATDADGNVVYDVYVFDSLELRRTTWDDTANDYVRNADSEVGYLFAHGIRLARLHYAFDSEPTLTSGQLHVLLEIPDYLGSAAMVIDRDTSELVERTTYLPFGGSDSDYRPARWNSFREDYHFSGKEEDIEVGLQYFGKRYLSSALGRWVSADPLTIHGLGADLNAYAYVHGNLLRSIDPTGLQEADAGAPTPGGGSTEVAGAPEVAQPTPTPSGPPGSPNNPINVEDLPRAQASPAPSAAPVHTATAGNGTASHGAPQIAALPVAVGAAVTAQKLAEAGEITGTFARGTAAAAGLTETAPAAAIPAGGGAAAPAAGLGTVAAGTGLVLVGVGIIVYAVYDISKQLDDYWHPTINYAPGYFANKNQPAPTPAPAPAAGNGGECNPPPDLHRPYIRQAVRDEVTARQPKDAAGNWLDPNTMLPIQGKPDLGHKPGHEFWREKAQAELKCMSQAEFNDYMNNADFYQYEDMHNNRSHKFEAP
jgi:RHS repeat-associated protein